MMLVKRYALHALVTLNVCLVMGLAWLWMSPDGFLRNIHWIEPQPQMTDFAGMLPVMPGVSQADTSRFIAMLDRPIFSATRRPPPPPPPPQAAESAPVDNLSTAQLSGLFVGDGVGGIIIQIAGKSRRVQLNQVVDGWSLRSIQGRNVTFSKGGQSRVLQLPRAAVTAYTGNAAANSPRGSAAPPVPVRPGAPNTAPGTPGSIASPPATGQGAPLRPAFGGRRP